jgi:hypothetical protein
MFMLKLGGCHPAGVLVPGVRADAMDHGHSSSNHTVPPQGWLAGWPRGQRTELIFIGSFPVAGERLVSQV